VEPRGRRGRRSLLPRIDGLIALGIPKGLVDVRRKRHFARRRPLEPNEPATVADGLDELDGPERLAGVHSPARADESLPQAGAVQPLDEEDLHRASRRPAKPEPSWNDPCVVEDEELTGEQLTELREVAVLDRAGAPPVDEQPRGVAEFRWMLGYELRRELVVEKRGVHPTMRVASPSMDETALERAKQRISAAAEGRPSAAQIDAALERSKEQIEALAAATAELESTIPARVGDAVRDGLRAEVLPVARHIAELRGLFNQAIRRLERLEGDLLAERRARVDDLELLVDLVSSGWRGVDARLARLEEHAESSAPVRSLVESIAAQNGQADGMVERSAAAAA
jgi:hypothetical protein